jgi:hypothetical protein
MRVSQVPSAAKYCFVVNAQALTRPRTPTQSQRIEPSAANKNDRAVMHPTRREQMRALAHQSWMNIAQPAKGEA